MTDRVIHRVPLDDLHLETQQFNSKDDIKPWLQGALRHNKGIEIVIERSDTTKIIFRCKNNVNEKRIVKSKRSDTKIPIRKHTTCPFKVRANYSVRNKVWTLLLVSDEHDHPVDKLSLNDMEHQKPGKIVKNSSGIKLSSVSSSSGPMELATSESISPAASFVNNRENPKPSSPTNRKTKSRGSKSSVSSSARSSQRNSTTGLLSQNSSAATSMDDFRKLASHDQQDPPPSLALTSSNSFHGINIHQPSDSPSAASSKRRKSVPSAFPKVRKLKDNFSTISPIQEDINVNHGFVVPGLELQQLQSIHPLLPQLHSRLEQLEQLEQPLQQSKQTRQTRQSRQNQRQRNINQVQLPSNKLSSQQQLQLHQLDNDQLQHRHQQHHQHQNHNHNHHQQSEGQLLQNQEQRQHVRTSEQFLMVHILQNLQNFVREKVKEEILDNKNIQENMKTDMIDSFVSQVILDYKNLLSPLFLYSLKQNVYEKRNSSDPTSDIVQNDPDHQQQQQQQQHHHQQQQQQAPQFTPLRKSNAAAQNWLPSSTTGVSGLIRLSPLLNDNDNTEYVVGGNPNNQNAAAAGQNSSLDSLTHLPGITPNTLNYLMQLPPPSTNSLILTSTSGSSSNQQFNQTQPHPLMPPLQNPGQQLPPLNTLQKLPPQGNVNNSNQGTLPPPLNNVSNSTLNPSSLLKSTKNDGNSGNNNNPGNTSNSNVNSGTNINSGSNSVFNSYFVNPTGSNSGFMFNNTTSNISSNSNVSKDGNGNNNANNMLNNMSNYDSGW